jgi:hypothetical protein
MMPPRLAQWMTDIGAEMRVRANIAALAARTRRIDDLLKIIAEREVAKSKEKRVSPR